MKTKLKNINLPSSYTHDFGVVLYEQVLKHQPEVVYDIGVLHGFSTAYLAMACKEIGAKVVAVDLFELYEYTRVSQKQFESNMDALGLMDVITTQKVSVDDWLDLQIPAEFIHIDVSNTGEILLDFFNRVIGKPIVLFEGGSVERDNCDWMIRYFKKTIIPTLKNNDIKYELLKSDVVKREDRTYCPSLSKVVL